jgi:hypothetical protein
VLGDRRVTRLVGRDDQHLGGALEGIGEGRGLGEVASPHAYAASGEVARAAGVPDADTDAVDRNPLEQPIDDPGAELTGAAGDDDHDGASSWCTQ